MALEKATSDNRLSPDDWSKLVRFLAAQDVRTPARLIEYMRRAKKEVPEILHRVLEKLENDYVQSEKEEHNFQNKTQSTEPFPLKVITHFPEESDLGILYAETYTGRSTWLYTIKHLLENTSKILHTHKWSIIKPAKGYLWPTSDNPVVKINYYEPGNYDLKGGWGVKHGNIIFPIDPEHAMFVQIGDKPIMKGTRLTPDQTEEFIKIIVENAFRMVFSINKNCDLTHLRKRIVDQDKLNKEKEEINKWHHENTLLENDYF